jgi:hypothetical protein
MARLTILTQEEIDTLYAIPSLDDEERSFLFGLDEADFGTQFWVGYDDETPVLDIERSGR